MRADRTLGGSFGVVYKAIEKATGETVAIKHVSHPHVYILMNIANPWMRRLISSQAKMTSRRFKARSQCSALAQAHLSPNTRAASFAVTSSGS